jgi:PAS domain S-box-containing protein
MPYPHTIGARAILTVNRSPWVRYGIALVLVILAVALRSWLHETMGHPSVAIFMGAILAGAWFGGVGPALLCLVLLHIVHGYGFQPSKSLFEPNLAFFVSLIAWYAIGITVGILSQMRASALCRARDEQLEADSQREHLRTTLLCMADGVLVTDAKGRLTLMNPAAEALTGCSLEEAKGKRWYEVLTIAPDDGQAGVESPIDRVLREGRVVHERVPLVLKARSGHTIPIAYSAAPVQAPETQASGVVLVFHDETERRRTELALQNADRRKDEFLATLAHELRNPLAPICTGLELLRLSGDEPEAAEEIRSMMQRQTQHMVRLIDDLLDVSRITRGKFELRRSPVELAEIVRDALAATRPLLDEAGHRLTVRVPDEPLLLFADANRLTQVLTNLLNNAAKYTPQQGEIELTAERSRGEVAITVADSGIGIPADKLESVFDMFTQIRDAGAASHTGLGIGLTLVKRLVEMHDGQVEVQSRGANRGTTFIVRLPLLSEPPAEAKTLRLDAAEVRATVKRRILVVDDNADALESLSRLVAAMGNDVRRANNGLEALQIGRTFEPEVVLMDLGMPGLSGYEAARRMRQEPWGQDLLLIATTGWGQDEDRRRTAAAGFDRHLVKPVGMAALREALDASPQDTLGDSRAAPPIAAMI